MLAFSPCPRVNSSVNFSHGFHSSVRWQPAKQKWLLMQDRAARN
jgi:hypothetical protein